MNLSILHLRDKLTHREETPLILRCTDKSTMHTTFEESPETLAFTWVEDPHNVRLDCLEITRDSHGAFIEAIVEQLIEQSRHDHLAPPYVGKPASFRLAPADLFWSSESLAASPPKVVVHRSLIADMDENKRLMLEYTYITAGQFCPRHRNLNVSWLPTVEHL